MKKVSDLSGPELDYFVAKAEGGNVYMHPTIQNCVIHNGQVYSPSTDWSQGGPIQDRERFGLIPVIGGAWCAERDVPTGGDDYEVRESYGPTALIAICRCKVAKEFGEEVAYE